MYKVIYKYKGQRVHATTVDAPNALTAISKGMDIMREKTYNYDKWVKSGNVRIEVEHVGDAVVCADAVEIYNNTMQHMQADKK